MRRIKFLAGGVTLALVIAATGITPASAQTTADQRHTVSSLAEGLSLTLFGTPVVTGGVVDVHAVSGPLVEASALGIAAEGLRSEVEKRLTDIGGERTPESGRTCATAALPPPLDDPSVLGIEPGCAAVEVFQTADGQFASAEAVLAGATINASALFEALVDFVIEPLVEGLRPLFEALEIDVEDPVTSGLLALCDLADTTVESAATPILDAIAAIEPLADITDAIADAASDLGDDCAAALGAIAEIAVGITVGDVDAILDLIRSLLLDALAGVDLLSLTVADSTAVLEVDLENATTTAVSNGATIITPSLGLLLDAIDQVLANVLTSYLSALGGAIGSLPVPVPVTVDELLGSVIDALGLGFLFGDDPFLRIDVGLSTATATADRVTGAASVAGTPSLVRATISEALATTLGIPQVIEVPEGGELPLFEGTPLESVLRAGTVTTSESEADGLTTQNVTVDGVALDLFTGVSGGVSVRVASAQAEVAALSLPQTFDTEEPTLPRTGAEDLVGPGLLLALAAFGLRALRRRADLAV